MANEEQVNVLKQGVAFWNDWRKGNPSIQYVDLTGARLRGANLANADLRGANFAGNDLREANLSYADLTNAILSDAVITNANLSGANLSKANLWWANLWNSNLSGATLFAAELWHANLVNANLSEANLEQADLSCAQFVETNLTRANLTGARVYGLAAWNNELAGAVQNDLVITDTLEPSVMVDDFEIAQFVYLILNHHKLRKLFNAVTERGVLILGRFSDHGLELLRASLPS